MNHTENPEYHSRYVGRTGTEIPHHYKTGIYVDYICINFGDSRDWIHKDDTVQIGE